MAELPENDSERLDLSAFEVPPPSPGLADRVLARLPAAAPRPPPRHSRRAVLAAVAAVLLIALPGAWLVSQGLGRDEAGERSFAQRDTVHLGASAVAVAERGSELRWTAAGRRGPVRVRQTSGRVFYRVETGSDFQVETPGGQVAVRGTCFTIEVQPVFPSKQSLTGAAVGAALTAAVFVTVHEGRVAVTSPAGATEVGPGERAVLSAGAGPRLVASSAGGDTTVAPAAPSTATQGTPEATPPTWQAREAAYVAELTALRERVKALEPYAPGSSRPEAKEVRTERVSNFLDPTPEELREMAKECRLRWDSPGLRPKSLNRPTPEQLKELNITEDEAEVMAEVHQAFVAESLEKLRAIYVAATGDAESARVLSPEALEQEVFDKSTEDSVRRAFQRVARERAGLAVPPADTLGLTPAERLVRFNTSLGDAYERAMADKLGTAKARELRRMNNGWGSRHSSGMGCPSQQ